MKNHLFHLLLLLLLVLFEIGCTSPEQRSINSLSALAEDIELNGRYYTQDDWEAVAESYEELEEELTEYSQSYTPEQRREIGRLKARCHKAILSYALGGIEDALNGVSDEMEGYMEEMSDGEELDGYAEDFEDVMEETVDEINEIFE